MPVRQFFTVEHPTDPDQASWELDRTDAELLYSDLSDALGYTGGMLGALAQDIDGISNRTYDIAEAVSRLESSIGGHWLVQQPEEDFELTEQNLQTMSVEEAAARMQAMASIQAELSPQRNPGTGIGVG